MKRIFAIVLMAWFNPINGLTYDDVYDTWSTTPGQTARRARGHDKDKDKVLSGDVLNGIYGRGYTGSAYTTSNGVSLELQASENWTGSAQGTRILLKTTQTGGTSAATVLTATNNGLTFLSDAAPRTNLTPPAAGTIIWNSADAQLCVSTGTLVSTWVQVSSPTVACSH